MKQPALPLGVAAIMAVAMSAAGGAGVMASGQRIELALAVAAILLAASHLAIFLYRDFQYRGKLAAMSRMDMRSSKLAEQLSRLAARLGALEEARGKEETPPPKPDSGFVDREFEELSRSIKRLAAEYGRASRASAPRREPETWTAVAAELRHAAVHRLEFFLEPIVSLAKDVTAHYRASLVLEGSGRRVAFDELARQAAANGLRPDLDVHAVSRALAVSPRLTARRPDTTIFVPIGPETLASQPALAAIEWQIGKARRAAASIVFEIEHTAMAALGPRGIEGMARLAHKGSGMALARAHGSGLDLAALRDLGFRLIIFSAEALPSDRNAVPVWSETARLAGTHGFTIGVQGLVDDEQVNVARGWAQLGSGPVFAPPRRVRGEAVPLDQIRSAA
jgi:hypothetical protein